MISDFDWLKVIAVTKQICLTPSVCLTASWCLHRSTSKSTEPFNACVCAENSEVPVLLHSTGGGGRLILQSSAVAMGQSGAACCRLPLATWAWCLLHGRGRHWHLQMGAGGERRKRSSHPHPFKSPPEIKEPPVTSLKAVLDQGRISALHFLSGMKQDDCYCGTLLQLWLQSSHFYLKKKRYTSIQPGVNKHVFHPLGCWGWGWL